MKGEGMTTKKKASPGRSSTVRAKRIIRLDLITTVELILMVIFTIASFTRDFARASAMTQTLAVGGEHACVITIEGAVKCWGENGKGQLGYGDKNDRGGSPSSMGSALKDVDLGTTRTAVSITAGDFHTCALLDDMTLKCWGYGNAGQLGQGDPLSRGHAASTMGDNLKPVNFGFLGGEGEGGVNRGPERKVHQAVAGTDFTCALLEDDEVVCFGNNDVGQLGIGSTKDVGKVPSDMGNALTPVDLGSETAVGLSSGPCALLVSGKVKCWGDNLYGTAGVPGTVDVGIAKGDMGTSLPSVNLGTGPSRAPLVASAVASGRRHNCAIVDDSRVKCWGKNTKGNLGVGDIHDRGLDDEDWGNKLPFTDLGLPALRVVGGTDHTCALLQGNVVKCWGNNLVGALGLNDYRTRGDFPGEMGTNLPTVYLGLGRTAVEISAGNDFTCAILDDGHVKCWGSGSSGKLGQGNTKTLGDERGEMSDGTKVIQLGPGVLAAAPTLDTAAPTPAPTSAPSSSPVLPPTAPETPSPTTTKGADTINPPKQTNDPQTTDSPAASPKVNPSNADGEGEGSSGKKSVGWKVAVASIAGPIGAAVLIAAFFALRGRSKTGDNAAPHTASV